MDSPLQKQVSMKSLGGGVLIDLKFLEYEDAKTKLKIELQAGTTKTV